MHVVTVDMNCALRLDPAECALHCMPWPELETAVHKMEHGGLKAGRVQLWELLLIDC